MNINNFVQIFAGLFIKKYYKIKNNLKINFNKMHH